MFKYVPIDLQINFTMNENAAKTFIKKHTISVSESCHRCVHVFRPKRGGVLLYLSNLYFT